MSAELRYIIAVVSKASPEGKALAREYHDMVRANLAVKSQSMLALRSIINELFEVSKGCRKLIQALLMLPVERGPATGTAKTGYLQQQDLERELGIGNKDDESPKGKTSKKRKHNSDGEQTGNTAKREKKSAVPQIIPTPAPKSSKIQPGSVKIGKATKSKEEKPQPPWCERCKPDPKNEFKSCGLCADCYELEYLTCSSCGAGLEDESEYETYDMICIDCKQDDYDDTGESGAADSDEE